MLRGMIKAETEHLTRKFLYYFIVSNSNVKEGNRRRIAQENAK
jgi:hypothetical protein